MAISLPYLLLFLPLFSLISLSSSLTLSSQTLLNAIETLSNSGFVSMALTLEITSPTILSSSSSGSATVFSPSDAAFSDSGQPPLSLLQYHLSPERLTPETLRSLSFGSNIQTLTPNPLVVTTASDGQISLNGVRINGSAVYDDGSLIVYGTDLFFDPSFHVSSLPAPSTNPASGLHCNGPVSPGCFARASDELRSRGYSVMASFLDLQLGLDRAEVTMFAPIDDVLGDCKGSFSEYVSIFRRHVVPCKISGGDLANLEAGTTLPTFTVGFTIVVNRSGGQLVLNGVPVSDEGLYNDGSIAVHGIHDVLKPLDQDPGSSLDFG